MALSADPGAVIEMSWEEYLAWDDNDDTYGEYLDGVFVMSPRPTEWHAKYAKNLLFALDPAIKPPYEFLWEVEWTPKGERQAPAPDLIVYWPTGAGKAVKTPILAVEILSKKRNYDLEYKRELYGRWGLPTYWILDPPNRALRILELDDGELIETERHIGGTHWVHFGPFNTELDLDRIFEI